VSLITDPLSLLHLQLFKTMKDLDLLELVGRF
jgi:hypothetical protein